MAYGIYNNYYCQLFDYGSYFNPVHVGNTKYPFNVSQHAMSSISWKLCGRVCRCLVTCPCRCYINEAQKAKLSGDLISNNLC